MDWSKENYYHLSKETMFKILENYPNEIFVTDKNLNIIYTNSVSIKQYGILPEQLIGKNFYDVWDGSWYPTALPIVYKEKRSVTIEQVTFTGIKIISVDVPVFDENDEIEMVICGSQANINNYDISFSTVEDNSINHMIRRQNDSEFVDFVTNSQIMKSLFDSITRIADKDISVLIQGESGTGKSMLAKYIHELSSRKDFPFVTINCAAIPENLLESELFGYVPHAFTGSNPKGKKGLIELANSGTLFLDEIGELPLNMQAKLLDVIENKRFYPVGGTTFKEVNICIIAATNQDLQKLVEDKRFREDLYWRLNIFDIYLPSLKDRKEDILPLCNYFLNKFNEKHSQQKVLSEEAARKLITYNWPGNIRQLKNIIEKLTIISPKQVIQMNDLPNIIINNPIEAVTIGKFDYLVENFEKGLVTNAYNKHRSSRKVAEVLGISQTKALRLINKYCIREAEVE
ncbi:histidine kinase [Sporosarcina sp. P13]|uniref:sigma-54 interaction domain-containing protein n=1 Tax=Sporosarcina sp. P13 TaxID=2048263 RepID=UPI000C1705B3|nr:sigma 54-interacting transcriptional regulator [Sporosarcina sp. P13]PIC63469.1 histidine kinase [Sporosarcina sp. P13]